MNSFVESFQSGAGHIFCLDAIDHILFLIVLLACYDYQKTKRIFWLVTAFTIGHAVTFIIAALGYMPYIASWAEIAIPITIGLTAIINLFRKERKGLKSRFILPIYLIASAFGAIHGLAMSSFVQMQVVGNQSFLAKLIGFNLGIELAQIIVVVVILFFQLLLMNMFRMKQIDWKIGASCFGLGASLIILLNKI